MNRFTQRALVPSALVLALFGATGLSAQAATLKIACSGLGQELELCKGAAEA